MYIRAYYTTAGGDYTSTSFVYCETLPIGSRIPLVDRLR